MNQKLLLLFFSVIFLFVISCGESPEPASESSLQNTNPVSDPVKGVPVEAKVLQAGKITQNIPLTGKLRPLYEVDLVAEVSGKVEKINKELGERVTPSDTLAYIDDKIPLSNYRQAQSQVLSAENNLKIAGLNLNSDKELLKNEDISQLAYENSLLALKTAQANHLSALASLSAMEKTYFDTRLTSPIAGFVSRKYVDLGTMVNPGTPLFRVVNISILKVMVGVPQANISRLKVGSKARVRISALNNAVFNGEVKYVSPQANESTGTFTSEIHVANTPDFKLKAGMTADISLLLTDDSNRLAVPDYSVVTRDGNKFVYRIKENKAQLAAITVLESLGSEVIVETGLAEGDTVVVVGMKNLGVDSRVWIETVH